MLQRQASRRGRRLAAVVLLASALLQGIASAQTSAAPQSEPSSKPAAKKKAPPKPTVAQLQRVLEEQKAVIAAQQELIAGQEAKIAEQAGKLQEQNTTLEDQKKQLAAMQEQLVSMTRRLDEIEQQLPALEQQKALEERLKRVEEESAKVPELPPDVVSAGDFPGSIRIPRTDAAVKFGGRIRTAAVFTLDDLGSEDRFLTNSIPVEPDDAAAGKGKRTTFSANTSRFNFEMRTPTGAGQLRTFIEGDFFGSNGTEKRTSFRLRHAFAQFRGLIVGQTWSTFSDPAADHQDLDFEGINGENVIRQAQIRYTWQVRKDLSVAAALETPEVSLTGGEGVNFVPDLVGRTIWSFGENGQGHVQAAVVLRQIRGDPSSGTGVSSTFAWGASLSGVVPFHVAYLTDRFIFQLNFGEGNARYINDLNSLGGHDAVFNPVNNDLKALPTIGWYFDYEHQWKEWERARTIKLRSSFIWSHVSVENPDFPPATNYDPATAYRFTNRYSVNLVLSPTPRIDCGLEYIYGTRQNVDGLSGAAAQLQFVGIFRF